MHLGLWLDWLEILFLVGVASLGTGLWAVIRYITLNPVRKFRQGLLLSFVGSDDIYLRPKLRGRSNSQIS
jgi:hypothetical protein